MVDLAQKVLVQLNYMVVTCGEFKETVLEIFRALFAPRIEAREKAKLSFFDGGSFDKMYKKLEKLINDWGKLSGEQLVEFNSMKVDENDCKRLIKILKDYKGKNSPHKLGVVKGLLSLLEKREPITYEKVKIYFYEKLKPLYSTKEIYTSTKESAKEIELLEEIEKLTEKWPDAHPWTLATFGAIEMLYKKYEKDISPQKRNILNPIIMNVLYTNAERYSKRAAKIEEGSKVYDEALKLKKYLDTPATLAIPSDGRLRASIAKARSKSVRKINSKNTHQKITKRQLRVIKDPDTEFEKQWPELEKNLKRGWLEFGSKGGLGASIREFTNSIRNYSANYQRGSSAIDEFYEYLMKGYSIIFMSKYFYAKIASTDFSKIEGNIQAELFKRKKELYNQNEQKYDVSEINKFIEQLKKEKF